MLSSPAPNQLQRFPTRLDVTWDQIEKSQNGAELAAIASKITAAIKPGVYAINAEVHDPADSPLKDQSLFIVMELNSDRSAMIRIWPENKKIDTELPADIRNKTTIFAVHGHRPLTEAFLTFNSSHAEIEALFAK